MTLIKKTFDYVIESEQSEREESSSIPGALIGFGILILYFSCLMSRFGSPQMSPISTVSLITGFSVVIAGIGSNVTNKKVIPTLKITLTETYPSGNLEGKPIFSTWREIDITKDVDELARRIKAATQSVIASREKEIALRLSESKKSQDKIACIAGLEKEALERLK